MSKEINAYKSRLIGNMLHIQFVDGESYVISLEEIVDGVEAAQQSVQADGALCADCGKSPAMEGCTVCAECGL